MSEEELAYIAGFLDADGSFSINKRVGIGLNMKGYQLQPRVGLVNLSRDVMDMIAKEYDIKIYIEKRTYYRGLLSKRKELIRFITSIHSHLRLKQEQATYLLLFCLSREESLNNKKIRKVRMYSPFKKGYYFKDQPYAPYTDFEVECCNNVLYLNLPKG